jgi:hypothetical protein
MDHEAAVHDLGGPTPPTRNEPLGRLTDEQVIGLLEEYRTRTSDAAGEFDSVIIELELEAVRRKLDLDSALERTPPELALERCRHWIWRRHVRAAARCMWDVSALGAWLLFFDIQRIEASATRRSLLHALLRVVETVRFGEDTARQRAEMLADMQLESDELDAFLRSCLAAHFNQWMMYHTKL